jgi:hypothetical protein
VTEDAVVNELVDSSDVRYAVIAGLRTETGRERLVIAYPNEKSLRDLIAAASIIALGFSSREEAAAGSRVSVPAAVASPQTPEAMTDREIDWDLQGFSWAVQPGRASSTLRRLAKFLVTSCRDIATSAAVMFASTNAVSAVIRMAMGSSV